MSHIHIALTGHRPKKLGGYDMAAPGYARLKADLIDYIKQQLKSHATVTCITGMAQGADMLWAEAGLAVATAYPGRVSVIAYLPYPNQADRWSIHARRRHYEMLSAVHRQVIAGEISASVSAQSLLHRRNAMMVDDADVLLALWDGSPSGTGHTVRKAREARIPVVVVSPSHYF